MKRRVLTVVTVVLLCVGVVAGATMAYLSSSSNVRNNFVFNTKEVPIDDLMKVGVYEPNWRWDSQIPDVKTGNDTNLPETAKPPGNTGTGDTIYNDWGIKKAVDFRPGSMIPKDPTIVNEGFEDFYVGVIVSLEPLGSGGDRVINTLKDLDGKFTIDWNDAGGAPWKLVHTKADGTRYYVYTANNGVVPAEGGQTPPLFNKIQVNNVGNDAFGAKDKFDIVVKAYAVQSVNESMGAGWTPEVALSAEFGASGTNSDKSWTW